jgi:hypothetical protein
MHVCTDRRVLLLTAISEQQYTANTALDARVCLLLVHAILYTLPECVMDRLHSWDIKIFTSSSRTYISSSPDMAINWSTAINFCTRWKQQKAHLTTGLCGTPDREMDRWDNYTISAPPSYQAWNTVTRIQLEIDTRLHHQKVQISPRNKSVGLFGYQAPEISLF